MWTSVRGRILLECIKNAGYEGKLQNPTESLETSVNRIHQLFLDIKAMFVVVELFPKIDFTNPCTDYVIYDKELFSAMTDYLNSEEMVLNYIIKPQLTDQQLNTIKCIIETTARLMSSTGTMTTFPDTLKKEIVRELSLTFDIANDKFISNYENIFVQLNDNLSEEFEQPSRKINRIRNEILEVVPVLDNLLFTRLMVFIRSRMINGAPM
jgi:hypothetical protein